MSKNIISKAIDREVIKNMSLSDLRKVNSIVNKEALMRVSEKERQCFKSQKEKEIEIETKFKKHKTLFGKPKN